MAKIPDSPRVGNTDRITASQFHGMSGAQLWALVSSRIGATDRKELASAVFGNHPGATSLPEMMKAGRSQYQARKTETNHILEPFGLEIRLIRKERGADGRLHTWYALTYQDDPKPLIAAANKPTAVREQATAPYYRDELQDAFIPGDSVGPLPTAQADLFCEVERRPIWRGDPESGVSRKRA